LNLDRRQPGKTPVPAPDWPVAGDRLWPPSRVPGRPGHGGESGRGVPSLGRPIQPAAATAASIAGSRARSTPGWSTTSASRRRAFRLHSRQPDRDPPYLRASRDTVADHHRRPRRLLATAGLQDPAWASHQRRRL